MKEFYFYASMTFSFLSAILTANEVYKFFNEPIPKKKKITKIVIFGIIASFFAFCTYKSQKLENATTQAPKPAVDSAIEREATSVGKNLSDSSFPKSQHELKTTNEAAPLVEPAASIKPKNEPAGTVEKVAKNGVLVFARTGDNIDLSLSYKIGQIVAPKLQMPLKYYPLTSSQCFNSAINGNAECMGDRYKDVRYFVFVDGKEKIESSNISAEAKILRTEYSILIVDIMSRQIIWSDKFKKNYTNSFDLAKQEFELDFFTFIKNNTFNNNI